MPDLTSAQKPTVFFLAGLGLGSHVFDEVVSLLGDDFEGVEIDLPGFGGASAADGTAVDDMVSVVSRRIRDHGSSRWILVGHSMGGKIATLVATRTLAGEPGLFGLAGVILLAASPPSPEPMSDERREEMISWAADGPLDDAAAREFVEGNVGAPLPPSDDRSVIADLRAASPEAWIAWLTRGSREDRAGDVGELDLPAVIVAGGADGDLGPDAQRQLNGPHYPRATFEVLAEAGHLLMLERAAEVATVIRRFWTDRAGLAPSVPRDVGRTIASSRTSSKTRSFLAKRAVADDPDYEPKVLNAAQLATLRAISARAVPQEGVPIDLAARVDAGLADGANDGWRNAALPADDVAYRQGLDALADFADLSSTEQDDRLAAIVSGDFEAPGGSFSAKQLNLWFEDCRVDLVRLWLGHPATMAQIGFDGFANGGDLVRIQGFIRLRADESEDWEPSVKGIR